MSGTIPLAPPGTGMISSASPFVAPDFTPTPLSFRFLFELWKDCGDYQRRLAALEARMGVTDGSNASAGQIGEYVTASGSGSLVDSTAVDLATLTLSAGDWQVGGSATFSPSTANMIGAQVWLNTTPTTPNNVGRLAIYSATPGTGGTSGFTSLVGGPIRVSIAAPATQIVYFGLEANFGSPTTVAAAAYMWARRMR